MFGDARVSETLDRVCADDADPARVVAELLDAVGAWHGPSARDDDETLVILRARPTVA